MTTAHMDNSSIMKDQIWAHSQIGVYMGCAQKESCCEEVPPFPFFLRKSKKHTTFPAKKNR